MAYALGIEQDCNECRMCGNGKGGKKMTNFERIKGMSVEELAEFLLEKNLKNTTEDTCKSADCMFRHKSCKDCFKEWLESECDAK